MHYFYSDNLTVGDNISIASNQASGYPSEATKVLYKNNYICALAETDAQLTTLNTLFDGGITLTKGTVVDQANGTDNNSVIWTALDNISGQSAVWFYSDDNEIPATHPDNFTDSDSTAWHTGDNITE